MPWLLIFFLTPIAEMYLLIEVAGYIDVWPTIGLVMLTAVIGVALLKRQGLATLTRGMSRLEQGQVPATEMAEGILLAIAGALLLTPGFFTDTVGFLLLFPPTRSLIAGRLLSRVQVHTPGAGRKMGPDGGALNGQFGTRQAGSNPHDEPIRGNPPENPVIIEGDFERRP